ncbi:MAG TPA: hypothetical protein VLC98_04815 [Phnomibacter sp.]|nr:hypothetical protein [Phnomibacter sp.]
MRSKLTILATALLCAGQLVAQTPEDALRYGFPISGGTARNQAIGGAMASLGGDITAAHINPAGIGLYKNKEMVVSPNFSFLNFNYNYRGDASKSKDNGMGYGTSGFVFGHENSPGSKVTSSAISISINQTANYNSRTQYKGFNNVSSWSEQYVEELVRNNATIPQAENNFIFGSSLAYWTFLVDTLSDANGNVIGYQSLVPLPLTPNGTEGVIQNNLIETKGGANEIAIAFANSYRDKFHLGLAINIPFYNYEKDQTYSETDASGFNNNDFASFEYKEHYSTKGVGFNAKLGLIYRPIDKLRLGFAFHTPTFASMSDRISSSITTNSENYTIYPQPMSKTSDELKGSSTAGEYEYNITTPYRLIGSISYVINEVKSIKQQKGFITADIEYVNYKGTRYRAGDGTVVDDVNYYNDLNESIKNLYKAAFNFRLGGELKFKTIMARLGYAYMGSPYQISELKANRNIVSGGLGYRHRSVFVDLTYAHAFIKNSHVPYWLQDKANPIADGKNNRGNVVLTVGFKFI